MPKMICRRFLFLKHRSVLLSGSASEKVELFFPLYQCTRLLFCKRLSRPGLARQQALVLELVRQLAEEPLLKRLCCMFRLPSCQARLLFFLSLFFRLQPKRFLKRTLKFPTHLQTMTN